MYKYYCIDKAISEKDCDDYYKELLLEVDMLYKSLFMLDVSCEFTNSKVSSIVNSIHRLLAKVECGICKNC